MCYCVCFLFLSKYYTLYFVKMSSNIENISYNELKNICRTCMCNCDIKFRQDCVISEIFYKLTDLHFETNDELPQQICQKCFETINGIHEFAFQCKQTHSTLTKCLKKLRLDEKQETNELIKIKEEIIIEEHKIEFVRVDELNSTNEDVIDEFKIKQEIIDNTNNEINDRSKDNLLILNTSKIIDLNPNDLDIDSNSSNTINSSNINSIEINKIRDKQYKCEVCNKTFICLNSFEKHKSLSNCELPHKCKHCPKSFAFPAFLKTHLLIHSNKRQYKCNQCSASFKQPSGLQKHLRAHSGERPFKCDQCPKTFARSDRLKGHMRTHSSERPFICEQCSRSFKDSQSLKMHMYQHTGDCPHKCKHCTKSFIRLDSLKKHMLTHNSPKSELSNDTPIN